jgi:hypothetical protein
MQATQDAIASFLTRALSNPHTTIAGVSWAICKLGAIWFPAHREQFEATEAFIVGYGFLAAGDSARTPALQSQQPDPQGRNQEQK